MAYQRPDVYPNGDPIPSSLPPSYQPAAYGEAPTAQSCRNCAAYRMGDSYCTAWDAIVKPRWWCAGWTAPRAMKPSVQPVKLYKRVSTTSVEEHFDTSSNQTMLANRAAKSENEEDVIRLNVPLMLRLLEWAREDSSKDVELHVVAEHLIELSEEGDTLTIGDYPEIVPADSETKQNKS